MLLTEYSTFLCTFRTDSVIFHQVYQTDLRVGKVTKIIKSRKFTRHGQKRTNNAAVLDLEIHSA